MIVITGPQGTADERGDLAEAAGIYGALVVGQHAVQWSDVTTLYRLPGWDLCPRALADVLIADALCVPTVDLTV